MLLQIGLSLTSRPECYVEGKQIYKTSASLYKAIPTTGDQDKNKTTPQSYVNTDKIINIAQTTEMTNTPLLS